MQRRGFLFSPNCLPKRRRLLPQVRESWAVSALPGLPQAPPRPAPPHPTVFPAKLYAVRNWELINNFISPAKISSVHFKPC